MESRGLRFSIQGLVEMWNGLYEWRKTGLLRMVGVNLGDDRMRLLHCWNDQSGHRERDGTHQVAKPLYF